jgi:hypothetical protein
VAAFGVLQPSYWQSYEQTASERWFTVAVRLNAANFEGGVHRMASANLSCSLTRFLGETPSLKPSLRGS